MTFDPQIGGLGGFGPRPGPGHQNIGLGRDRARHLGPQGLCPCLGLGPGHAFEGAGKDHGLARDRAFDRATRAMSCTSRCATSRSIDARSAPCWKAVTMAVASTSPTPSMASRSCHSAPSPGVGLGHRGLERLPAAVMAGEKVCRRFADMADAEGEDQAVQRDASLFLDGGEKVGGRTFTPAISVLQLLQRVGGVSCSKGEDIGGLPDRQKVIGKEHLDLLRAKPFDVEGGAADEMLQPFNCLRRADQAAGAAPHRVALLPDRFRTAFRA